MVSAIQNKKEITMNMFMKKIIWLIIIVPAIYLALAWNRLPEKIAMHFDLKGNINGYGSKNDLLLIILLLTVLNAGIYLLLTNIFRIDPKKYAVENKSRFQRMAFAISVFLSAVLCLVIYSGANQNIKFSPRLVLAGVGLLFAFIGNYMHNIKPNYFAGIRLPWTLENEENWKKTHLLAGKLFFAGGLLIAVICPLIPVIASIAVFFTITIIITVIPCVYSYRLYKKQKALNL
jgi:uncharacterized membrane protein